MSLIASNTHRAQITVPRDNFYSNYSQFKVLDTPNKLLLGSVIILLCVFGFLLFSRLGPANSAGANNPSSPPATAEGITYSDQAIKKPVLANYSAKQEQTTTLIVNGQTVPVPDNGSVNTVVAGQNGSGSAHVEAQKSTSSSQSNNSSSSYSKLMVQVRSISGELSLFLSNLTN